MSDRHPITIVKRGVETRLDTYAYGIETKNGVHAAAALEDMVPEIPGRSGQTYVAGKRRRGGAAYLSMYVQEYAEDGAAQGADSYSGYLQNLDKLFKLFDTSMEQIIVREYTDVVPDGASLASYNYREALCEVGMMLAPELRGRHYGRLVVECLINDGSWREKTLRTQTIGTTAGTFSVGLLAGGTAHIEDAVICVDGPVTNPVIRDVATGHQVQYNGTVANGQQLVIDCANWLAKKGSGLEFNAATGTNVMGDIVSFGVFSPRLWALSADSTTCFFNGSSLGANTRLRIQARRRFL